MRRRFDPRQTRPALAALTAALALAALAACQGPTYGMILGNRGDDPEEAPGKPSPGKKDGGASSGGDAGASGADGGPAGPLDPNGFTLAIAPLLDKEGCSECHHPGRPVDLSKYPFMAGTPGETADKLIASFSKDMPPAPRDKASAEVVEKVKAWKAAGMKP